MRDVTLPTVAAHEDFAEAAERFRRWWTCEPTDRPAIAVNIAPRHEPRRPAPRSYATLRERWLDGDRRLECRLAELRAQPWIAESLPVLMPNLGPALLCVLFGAELTFSETTTWAEACIDEPDQDYPRLAEAPLQWDNPLWQAMESMTDRAVELAADEVLPGITDLHGAYDTVAGLRHSDALCLDLLDCPELVQPVAMRAAEAFNGAFERLHGRIAAAGFGSTSWTPFYHHGPAYISNCDFWCLVSRPMARELILPTTRAELTVQERSLFHLDGPDALRHLDLLLAEPGIQAVQWIYGAGNEPATRWLRTYRQILEAGKGIHFITDKPDDVLEAAPQLGARGVFYQLTETFDEVGEARDFVAEVARRARG
jgi:hypothetical protein